jgi:nucleotide-binding universal stress UspA family protein
MSIAMASNVPTDNSVKGKNLLLATDGKPHSEKAIKYAMDLAKLTSSKLYVLYVINPKRDEDKQGLIQEGMKYIHALKDRADDERVEMITMLEGGSPYETILSTSERVKAGAIIVGSSGKTALDRVLIGSVSEYVSRNSSCTVIIVK